MMEMLRKHPGQIMLSSTVCSTMGTAHGIVGLGNIKGVGWLYNELFF